MLIPILEFIGGCIILAIGANNFLKSSIVIAKRYHLSPLIIGVVLVGFGTSFAEVVVAAVAASHGKAELAIGNVLGSNIANMGLVIGFAAMVLPITVSSRFIKREFPILLLITLIAGAVMWDNYLGRLDAIILLLVLLVHVGFTFYLGPKDKVIKQELRTKKGITEEKMSFKKALVMWPAGLAYLFISSELIVDGATQIATWLHMSEMLIGLTVVAVGTSLPELATIVLSTQKKQHDVAIGTIIGSNIFNLLAVLAVPALISPTHLPKVLMHVDYPILLGFTLLFYLFSFWPRKQHNLHRLEGAFLLLSYVGYVCLMLYID